MKLIYLLHIQGTADDQAYSLCTPTAAPTACDGSTYSVRGSEHLCARAFFNEVHVKRRLWCFIGSYIRLTIPKLYVYVCARVRVFTEIVVLLSAMPIPHCRDSFVFCS